jgi:Domain of unknown function (DUF4375)
VVVRVLVGRWSARQQTCDHDGTVEPDWAALEDLDDNQLAATLLEYLDAVMAGRSAEAEDALLAVLPWPLQVLWLLSWLEFEVTQGSLLAYFFNSAGRHAALAVAALHDIGAGRMEQVLTEAAAVVAAGGPAWDKGRCDLARSVNGRSPSPTVACPKPTSLGAR